MAKPDKYTFWREELADPGKHDRMNPPEFIAGFYRAEAAKTKPDYPVAIWYGAEDGRAVFKVGNRQRDSVDHPDEWQDFLTGTFLKIKAVPELHYHTAMKAGVWSDAKPARQMDDAEKQGIDISPGDNQAPVEETIAEQIAAMVEKANAIAEPTTQAEANAASAILDKLRTLWKLGEAERIKEKAPHDQAAAEVQAKWKPILEPAVTAGADLDNRRKAFLRKEQAKRDEEARLENERRRREAEAAQEVERKRLQDIADAEAAAKGEEAPEVEAPEVVVEEVQPERATAGATFGRNSGLKKTRVAKITDAAVFCTFLLGAEDQELMACLQKRADAATRARVTMPGVTVEEVLK